MVLALIMVLPDKLQPMVSQYLEETKDYILLSKSKPTRAKACFPTWLLRELYTPANGVVNALVASRTPNNPNPIYNSLFKGFLSHFALNNELEC